MSNGRILEDRVIIVTGASSGIGRAVALKLAEEGARVACCGRDVGKMRAVCAELHGSGHFPYVFDGNDLSGVEEMIKAAVREMGRLSGLVHSAGVSFLSPLRDTHYGEAEEMFRINYFVFLALAKIACRKGNFVPRKMSIVGISSISAFSTPPGMAVYAASKAALNASIVSYARELAPRGIRFNSVCPAYVDTRMTESLISTIGETEFRSRVEKSMPLGLIEPNEVADSVLFLLSDASRKITGANIKIGGGAVDI